MGEALVNSRLMQNTGRIIVVLVVSLNIYLLVGQAMGM